MSDWPEAMRGETITDVGYKLMSLLEIKSQIETLKAKSRRSRNKLDNDSIYNELISMLESKIDKL